MSITANRCGAITLLSSKFDNVIITPHIAGATRESIAKHTAMIAADLQRYVAGEPLLYQWR